MQLVCRCRETKMSPVGGKVDLKVPSICYCGVMFADLYPSRINNFQSDFRYERNAVEATRLSYSLNVLP